MADLLRATLAGNAEAERRIQHDLTDLTQGIQECVGSDFEALLLLGGYARGEGSLVERDGKLGPYNDYDLVVVVRGSARKHREPLTHFAELAGKRVGVEVDVWPMSRGDLTPAPRILLWLDAALDGVNVLAGDASVLDSVRALKVRDIPLSEGGRLLANRAVGLALSNLEEDYDLRRARHAHKMVLALGDVSLLSANRYAGTLAARLGELESLRSAPSVGDELVDAFRDAIQFRARPDLWKPKGSLDHWYASIRQLAKEQHLRFESFRIGTPNTPLAYASHPKRIYPEPFGVRTGASIAAQLRARVHAGTPLWPYAGHPRERLARIAMLLAYEPEERSSREKAAAMLGIGHNASNEELHSKLRALSALGG